MLQLKSVTAIAGLMVVAFVAGRGFSEPSLHAQTGKLSALDYQEITQLINRYAYGIDTCGNDGYDYADVFTADGVFIDKNSDEGFRQGGRVLAKGREALATLTPSPAGATGRVYLVQLGMRGPGSVDRHGGYEDVYVRTAAGWRIQSRTHVRNKAWHSAALQTPDLN